MIFFKSDYKAVSVVLSLEYLDKILSHGRPFKFRLWNGTVPLIFDYKQQQQQHQQHQQQQQHLFHQKVTDTELD